MKHGHLSQPWWLRWAGLVAAFITAGVVSGLTPDGNLVVTLVPALVVGVAVHGLASWRWPRLRRRQP